MVNGAPDLFTMDASNITDEVVRTFVARAYASGLHAESLVLEFKQRNTDRKVPAAVAAMANTDGGLVLVGVKDDDESDPVVGIERAEVDVIVQQLRALTPQAMPEVIPVALPGTDRLVLVLRVDADQAQHPVVLNGKVFKRVPGATVGARRDEILALAAAGQTAPVAAPGGMTLDPGRFLTFGDEPAPSELRIHAQWLLPRHVLDRRYLGTGALEAAVDELLVGPVPNHICSDQVRGWEMSPVYWEPSDTASLRATFRCEADRDPVRGFARFDSCAHMQLNGRWLDTLVATALSAEDTDLKLSLSDLRDQLLSTTWAAVTMGVAVASELGVANPVSSPRLDGWVKGPIGPSTMDIQHRWGVGDRELSERRFDPLVPPVVDIARLDEVVREWLTPLLFDLGATGFEPELAVLPLPAWVRRLELAGET